MIAKKWNLSVKTFRTSPNVEKHPLPMLTLFIVIL